MEYDAVIVGACTAGTYFADLLGKAGLRVLVIDKDTEENLCKRMDIAHLTTESYARFGVEKSQEGDEDFVSSFDTWHSKSAMDRNMKSNYVEETVLHLPLFIKKLRKKAIEDHVEFRFGECFDHLLYDENKHICGISTKSGEDIYARLVVDASGIVAAVRRTVQDPYMENFETGPRDKFYVILKYVEFLDKNIRMDASTSWPYYKSWIAPQQNKNGAIIGTGANLSFDYARKCMDKFESRVSLPEYRFEHEEAACTPYRRPPFSFVTDGFLVIGDAACLTQPSNGEGIPSAWAQCAPAADVVIRAMKDGKYPTKEALWEINTLYQKDEGAYYAGERAMLIGVVDMTPEDNDYLYRERIMFRSDDEPEPGNIVLTLLKGVIKGEFSAAAFRGLLKAILRGKRLEKHYKNYPDTPAGYPEWEKKAVRLWEKAGSMADTVKDA